MPAVPKPTSKPKEKNNGSSLRQKKPLKAKVQPYKTKEKKKKESPLSELKKLTLSQHNHMPTRKDRGDFPEEIVRELKDRADGCCECGCSRPDNETHHVMPRTRDGRGVKTNGMRVNTICNQRFHDNEDELQYWIEVYRERHGEFFWYDEQDWIDHKIRERQEKRIAQQEQELVESYMPITLVIESALGRNPTMDETRLFRKIANNKKDIQTLVDLIIKLQAS
ncbi:HNH endonuclease (plasmid) [Rossellomorea sp. AcN35-11]|nr:HNH endonuclease [Rossellomorea aquimaris]WJV32139.1 HNH endonuclease [Rossellomorea sp. AcN35-11]